MKAGYIGRRQFLQSWIPEGKGNCYGVMSTGKRSPIRQPVQRLKREGRNGMVSAGCANVDEFDGGSILGNDPDAGALDLQQAATRL